jgi:cell division protein ZapA (FtsZ GTPase activity inhibitor)
MTADDLTWTKAKNALLVAAAGGVVLIALQIMADVSKTRGDVADIKVALASREAKSEAESKAMNDRVARIERALESRR